MKTVRASEGMYLTNGKTYTNVIYMPDDADMTEWHEATLEEYEVWIASQEKQPLPDDELTDSEALGIITGGA